MQPYDFLCLGFADLSEGGVDIRRAALLEGGVHESSNQLIGQCALLLCTWRTIGHPLVIDIGPCACVGSRLLNRTPPPRILALDGHTLVGDQIAFLVVSSPSWQLQEVDKALLHSTLDSVLTRSRKATDANDPATTWRDAPVAFTPREIEVVALVAKGLTNKEIARELGLSPNTVRNHLSNLSAKTGCRRRAQLATLSVRFQLATGDPPDSGAQN
ncbi:helix-turn-helix domain-containing protein [Denitromonas sp. IR12]|uniref:Helix-turn-helix domain-containing protein n=2 Tax=Denitromonas iodatirespirans TaxID=2795389 RepID=A0A944HDY0_DENI1|nr:helix-turn-helix domain-containing protein [Denitromonas iodatirespirans]